MKKLVFWVLLLSVLSSCEDSDDSTQIPEGLSGKWELQSASCFCFFEDDFDFSAHKINFDNAEEVLTVENTTETFFIAAAGSYDFEVQNKNIVIRDVAEYNFKLMEDTLMMSSIDDPELADAGITLSYKKIN